MVGLLVLPHELLGMILDCVGPDDLDNFVSSHDKIREVAGDRRLEEHKLYQLTLTTVSRMAQAYPRHVDFQIY